MQKIKILVEIFNGYYEQRAVKDAIAKHAFVAAIKAAKLLPAGTKYEEEKKAELIKLLSSMTGDPDKKVNGDDTLISTDEICESKAGEIADQVIGIGDGIDTTQGETYSEKIPVFRSSNMSFEVSLMNHIVSEVAKYLKDSDIEIVETK